MDQIFWHFAFFEQFGNMVYENTLNKSHFLQEGKIHHQEKFYTINDSGELDFAYNLPTEYQYYVKLSRGSEYFILPRCYLKSIPLDVKEFKEVRLKPSDTQLWKLITKVDSLAIPEEKIGTFKQFLQRWNPMNHSNLKVWYTEKMIAICEGIKIGICGDVGVGKNANLSLRRHIDRSTIPKVKASTKAVLYTELYYNDYINLDEITSWSKTSLGEVEDMIAEFGDESPDMQKYAKDKNKNLELMNNILYKSLTFTFNPYDEKDNPYTLEEKFRNPGKIKDRYPILYFPGKVLDSIPKPSSYQARKVVKDNLDDFRSIASEFMYWRNNYHKHLHGWTRNNVKFYRRHLSNINPLIDMYDVFSDTQEEFDAWIDFLNKSRDAYNVKSNLNQNIKCDVKEEDVE